MEHVLVCPYVWVVYIFLLLSLGAVILLPEYLRINFCMIIGRLNKEAQKFVFLYPELFPSTGSGFPWRLPLWEDGMLEGPAVLGLSQYWHQGPSAPGCLDWTFAKTSCSQRAWCRPGKQYPENSLLDQPCSPPTPPSSLCYVDAVVITVYILKDFILDRFSWSII